ncbi:hypothetical protein ACHAWC_008648 [Mediolabrus comicus]
MAPTTKKSSSTSQPVRDFAKRPRAKVGKRAPAKVNATDTSFKTATVAVRSQGQSLDKSKQQQGKDATLSSAAKRMELFSSRGNTLSTLQMSLRHHAAAVRASGLKGIRDAVQSLSALDVDLGVAILEANLPSLLPHLCRCWLDDDDDVRSLALNLYGDILKCLSSSPESADLKCLGPFVPFLCAYASSALNSLDRSIRIDGASIVAMLASAVQSPSFSQLMSTQFKVSATTRELCHHADSLLPSMERLLSSISFGRRASSDRSKEKQKANSTGGQKRSRGGKSASEQTKKVSSTKGSSTTDSILLSLAFLLRSSLASDNYNLNEIKHSVSDKTKRDLCPSLYVSGECSFLKGGSCQSNSILLVRGTKSRNKEKVSSIRDLPTIQDGETDSSANNTLDESIQEDASSSPKEKDTHIMEKVQQMTSLLETLRMKFVELSHLGKKTDETGLMMPSNDIETMDVLVQIIRLSHSRFLSNYQSLCKSHTFRQMNTSASSKKREKSGKKTVKGLENVDECLAAYQSSVDKVLMLLLENFPIRPSFDATSNTERYEFTNACMCSALAELGGGSLFGEEKKNSSQWVASVFSYVLPRLVHDNNHYTDESSNKEDDSYSESIATNMLLKVVMKLLLPGGSTTGDNTQAYLLEDVSKRHELLDAFAKAFFPRLNCPSTPHNLIYASSSTVELERKVTKMASTAAGRTACILVTRLIAESTASFFIPSSDTEYTLLLIQMLSVLPTYVISWEGNFPTESGLVLASILSVIRQWKTSDDGAQESISPATFQLALEELCLGLRHSLEALFIPISDSPEVQPRKKRKKVNLKQTCVFERLPEQVQKLAIGLVGLLQSPTEATTKNLAKLCSKAFISHNFTADGDQENDAISLNMANYIREVIHFSRRTMPMPTYLSFLLDGSDIERAAGISLLQHQGPDNVFLYDAAIEQLSRFLTSSTREKPSQKVLPMVRPIIEKWLLAPTKNKDMESASNDTIRLLVKGRAAVSIVSAFALDEVLSYNSSDDFVPPDFLALDSKFDQLLLDCILRLIEASGNLWSKGSYFDDLEAHQLYLARLLGPAAVLLRYRSGMLQQFLETVSKRIITQSSQQKRGESSSTSAVVEIYIKSILMVLKSKEPVLMTSMVQRIDDIQRVLLSSAQSIETAVSTGPLAHLGGKLQHHVKTMCNCNQ